MTLNPYDDSVYAESLTTKQYAQKIKALNEKVEELQETERFLTNAVDAAIKDREFYEDLAKKYESQIRALQQVVEVNQRTAERYIRLFKQKFNVKDILQLEADSNRYKFLISHTYRYTLQLGYIGLRTKEDYDKAIDNEIALDKSMQQ